MPRCACAQRSIRYFVCLFVPVISGLPVEFKRKCIIPSFLGLGFADLQNRTLFSSYDNICSPGRPPKAPTTPSRENLLMLACL